MEKELCSKCENPLSSKYWLTLYKEDGTEEKIFCGAAPNGRHVAVYHDVKCPVKTRRISDDEADAIGIKNMSRSRGNVIYSKGRAFSMADVIIKREGDRVLIVMPKVLNVPGMS